MAQVYKSVLAVLLVLFMVKGCDRNIFGSTPLLSIYIYIYYLVILNLLFFLLLLLLNRDARSVCPAGSQPRPSTHSVLCRTSTTTIHVQCSLPDLNHDHPRPVFPAGPQPRPSTPSVSLPDFNREYPRQTCSLPDLMRYAR